MIGTYFEPQELVEPREETPVFAQMWRGMHVLPVSHDLPLTFDTVIECGRQMRIVMRAQ